MLDIEESAVDTRWLILRNSGRAHRLPTDQMLFRGGVSYIKVWRTINPVLTVMMAMLGILVAIAVFLETVSATSVSFIKTL